MIHGVRITKRRDIRDARGRVRKFMTESDPIFRSELGMFGEVYFSSCNAGVVKAWHLHKKMTLNYVAVKGRVIVGLVDDRENSPTRGEIMTVPLEDRGSMYRMLTIPPFVWNGFRGHWSSMDEVIVANFTDYEHDPDEIERKHPDDFPFNFDWGRYWLAG